MKPIMGRITEDLKFFLKGRLNRCVLIPKMMIEIMPGMMGTQTGALITMTVMTVIATIEIRIMPVVRSFFTIA
jgi:hypothetical protein